MIPRLSQVQSILTALTFLTLVLIAHAQFSPPMVRFAVDLMVVAIAAYHTINHFLPAVRAVKRGVQTGVDRLNLHLWLVWAAFFLQRDWMVYQTVVGSPKWMIESPFPVVIAAVIFIAGVFGALAPVSDNVTLPRRETIVMMLSAAFSGIVAGVVIGVYFIAGQIP